MDAIILAAGRGSRLGNITVQTPKPMVLLAGKSLFEWQCQSLTAAGINHISVITGYGAAAFDSFDGDHFYNPRWQSSNMVESLCQAASKLSTGVNIISYGDIAYRADIVQMLMACSADIAISCDLEWYSLWQARFDDPLSDAETFEQIDGKLAAIGERTDSLEKIQGQYMGLLKITPTGWGSISSFLDTLTDEQVCRIDMTTLLRSLLSYGVEISVVNIQGGWVEVDTPHDLELYEEMVKIPDWPHSWK